MEENINFNLGTVSLRGRRSHGGIVVGFTTTYAIGAYHH